MTHDLAGLKIGHATDTDAMTGCTVLLCPPGATAGVDVRGPAPGSRELTLLRLDKTKDYVHAILLTGGSAFGLAAADGVMRYLSERDIGHQTPVRKVPLVPTAVVYDMFLGGGKRTPDAEMGYAACEAAVAQGVAEGNVGAGAGVTVGKWTGPQNMMKAGFGLASVRVDELVVGAAAVVNAIGDVVEADGSMLAGARQGNGWQVEHNPFRLFPAAPPLPEGTNTTLVVAYTNAKLSKILAVRLAQRVHDGMAIAIRPVHTSHDGDTGFALATHQIDADFDMVANIAVDVVAEAIRNGVRRAASVGSLIGLAG